MLGQIEKTCYPRTSESVGKLHARETFKDITVESLDIFRTMSYCYPVV